MSKDPKHIRRLAVKRFLKGESAIAICASFGKSSFWLYKWVKRFDPDDPTWCQEYSRRPINTPHRTPIEIEEVVKMIRLNLYNNCFAEPKPYVGRWKIWVRFLCLQSGPLTGSWPETI